MTDHEERSKRMEEEIRQRETLIRKAEELMANGEKLFNENQVERGIAARFLDSDECKPELRDKVRAELTAFDEKMRERKKEAAKKHLAETQGAQTRKKPKMGRTMV